MRAGSISRSQRRIGNMTRPGQRANFPLFWDALLSSGHRLRSLELTPLDEGSWRCWIAHPSTWRDYLQVSRAATGCLCLAACSVAGTLRHRVIQDCHNPTIASEGVDHHELCAARLQSSVSSRESSSGHDSASRPPAKDKSELRHDNTFALSTSCMR